MDNQSLALRRKVIASTVGAGSGAYLGTLVLWALTSHGIEVPADVATAINGIVALACSFLAGYFVPESK